MPHQRREAPMIPQMEISDATKWKTPPGQGRRTAQNLNCQLQR